METIRSFIAIELPQEIKLALARVQDKLKAGNSAPVRWVDPEDIHLTLKFLGNIDADLIGKINGAMEAAVHGVRPFRVEVNGLGVFPNPSRVRVVWVGLGGEIEKLNQLQKRVEAALTPLGFAAEDRPFSPHLTLGRVRDNARPEERRGLGELISRASFDAGAALDVKSVHLIKSQLMPEGPIYTKIHTVVLK